MGGGQDEEGGEVAGGCLGVMGGMGGMGGLSFRGGMISCLCDVMRGV